MTVNQSVVPCPNEQSADEKFDHVSGEQMIDVAEKVYVCTECGGNKHIGGDTRSPWACTTCCRPSARN